MKTCKQCNTDKPLESFSKAKSSKDGLFAYCKPCDSSRSREWRLQNLEYNKDKIKRKDALYSRNNKAKIAAKSAARRARKLEATPKWLTGEQKRQIQEFYDLAAEMTRSTGIPHEVDHIAPLVGVNSRGLHVPWNLQILTKSKNRSKGNMS
jgi:hypothetical protein